MRPFAYEAPVKAAAAVALATVSASAYVTAPVQYKGGGTTLIDLMKLDVMRPTTVVDITAIDDPAMRRIDRADEGLRIGSLVTMAALHADPAIAHDYPILTESLWQAASQQLRNMARLGATCSSGRVAAISATRATTSATSACRDRAVPPWTGSIAATRCWARAITASFSMPATGRR